MLHPAIGSNRFCGPAALASLLGISTDEAAQQLRGVSGKRAIYGVRERYMLLVLDQQGLARPVPLTRRVRVIDWIEGESDGDYLVVVGNHYLTVAKDVGVCVVCDNTTVYPLLIHHSRQGRRFVKQAWRIEGNNP